MQVTIVLRSEASMGMLAADNWAADNWAAENWAAWCLGKAWS